MIEICQSTKSAAGYIYFSPFESTCSLHFVYTHLRLPHTYIHIYIHAYIHTHFKYIYFGETGTLLISVSKWNLEMQ